MLYTDPISTTRMFGSNGKPNEAMRRTVALQELEHFFTFTLLQEMRKSVPEDGLLEGGPQRRMFEEMLDDTLSGEMAKSGQLGLASQIEAQLKAAELQAKLAAQDNKQVAASGLPLHKDVEGLRLDKASAGLRLKRYGTGMPLHTRQGLETIQAL